MIHAMLSTLLLSVFLINSSRVCAGFYIEDGSEVDRKTYLISRGYMIQACGVLGILKTISALFTEENSAK